PAIMRQKRTQEQELRQKLSEGTEDQQALLAPWLRIADVQKEFASFEREYDLLERGDAFFSQLFTIARQVARLTEEIGKPNTERLREYRDSNLESLKFQLFSPAPIHAELERAKLTASLTLLADDLGGN